MFSAKSTYILKGINIKKVNGKFSKLFKRKKE